MTSYFGYLRALRPTIRYDHYLLPLTSRCPPDVPTSIAPITEVVQRCPALSTLPGGDPAAAAAGLLCCNHQTGKPGTTACSSVDLWSYSLRNRNNVISCNAWCWFSYDFDEAFECMSQPSFPDSRFTAFLTSLVTSNSWFSLPSE